MQHPLEDLPRARHIEVMEVKLFKKPELTNPVLIAGWAGIGGVGVIAVDTLRLATEAERFAEIAPRRSIFPPMPISAGADFLKNADLPTNSFYSHRMAQTDLIFFVGQAPPRTPARLYQTGKLVLDLAEQFQCKRVYIAGAAVSRIHHTASPKVWATANQEGLMDEIRNYPNTLLMSVTQGSLGHKRELFGLNSIVLEDAKRRGLESICLLGEIPSYISHFPHTPYPKASRPIVEVLATVLGIELDSSQFDDLIAPMEESIDKWVDRLPPKLRTEIDELKDESRSGPADTGSITEEDKQHIMEEVERFFKTD